MESDRHKKMAAPAKEARSALYKTSEASTRQRDAARASEVRTGGLCYGALAQMRARNCERSERG